MGEIIVRSKPESEGPEYKEAEVMPDLTVAERMLNSQDRIEIFCAECMTHIATCYSTAPNKLAQPCPKCVDLARAQGYRQGYEEAQKESV